MRASHSRWIAVLAVSLGLGTAGSAQSSPRSRIQIPDAAQPQLAVDTQGRVWLAYGQVTGPAPAPKGGHHHGHLGPRPPGDILVARSDDGGATFGPARRIASLPNLMLGNRRGPRIAVHGDRLTVTAIAHELFAFTSSDRGSTWRGPVTINAVPASAREGLHNLAGAPDGDMFVTWLDLRNDRMELWGADSKDGGRTWGSNEPIYRSPEKSICECCHPSAVFDAAGNLAVMWRNALAGSRDMWLAMRAKDAATFDPPRKLGKGTWQLNACPMDGGAIVAVGSGRFATVWQRAGNVFFAPDQGAEVALGSGRHPVALTRDGETRVVWQQGADLVSTRPSSTLKPPRKLAENARFPVIAALPEGGAVLAYEQGSGAGVTSVVVERL